MTGIESAIPARTSMVGPSLAGSSTSAGRCRVTRTKSLLLTAFLPSTAGRFTSSSNRKRLSIIVLPTSCTPSPVIPSPARFSTASGEVQSSTSETRSVRTRFTSSGISQSRERRPDSMWATATRELGGGQRRGQGGIDVAGDQHQVGGVLQQVGLDAGERRGRLLGVGARADAEVGIRLAHLEALDESPGERLVVVLARMQEPDRDPVGLIQRGDHRSRLDEVGPRPHDGEY